MGEICIFLRALDGFRMDRGRGDLSKCGNKTVKRREPLIPGKAFYIPRINLLANCGDLEGAKDVIEQDI